MRLIDADELMDELRDRFTEKEDDNRFLADEWWRAATVRGVINDAPAIEAEPVRHGHWVWSEFHGKNESWYKCSACDAYDLHVTNTDIPYCWACGAKMGGDEE